MTAVPFCLFQTFKSSHPEVLNSLQEEATGGNSTQSVTRSVTMVT